MVVGVLQRTKVDAQGSHRDGQAAALERAAPSCERFAFDADAPKALGLVRQRQAATSRDLRLRPHVRDSEAQKGPVARRGRCLFQAGCSDDLAFTHGFGRRRRRALGRRGDGRFGFRLGGYGYFGAVDHQRDDERQRLVQRLALRFTAHAALAPNLTVTCLFRHGRDDPGARLVAARESHPDHDVPGWREDRASQIGVDALPNDRRALAFGLQLAAIPRQHGLRGSVHSVSPF